MKIAIEKIFQNPEQPRKEFDQDELDSLASSIKEYGLINPISVMGPYDNDIYILIDGERRWRASKLAGLKEIEASTRMPENGTSTKMRLAMATIANLQRSDLNPLEEAKAFLKLRENGYSANQIAEAVGMYQSAVFTRLKILDLEPEIQQLFAQRQLPLGYQVVAALQKLPDDIRIKLASSFARKGSSTHAILSICTRLMNRRKYGADDELDHKSPPGMQLAYKHSKNHANLGHWNAFSQTKQVPPWKKIQEAVLFTCDKCALSDFASEGTCKDCPIIDLLKYLMEDRRIAGHD